MIRKLLEKLTFKAFRNYVLENQSRQAKEINQLHDQIFLSNPILILDKTQIYLPLFYVDHIQKTIYQTKDFYEKVTLDFLKEKYSNFDNIIDVGSNIGNHVLYYCNKMQAKTVRCFEPNQINREVLIKNIALNKLEHHIEVFDKALGEKLGKGIQKDFEWSNTGMNRIEAVNFETDNTVDIVTMDSYRFEKIDFIKIDVEGFEIQVLMGAQNTIKNNKPVIMIEVFENNLKPVNEILKRLNYSLKYTIEDHNLIYESIEN
jgi:FkbM family methyltransferase